MMPSHMEQRVNTLIDENARLEAENNDLRRSMDRIIENYRCAIEKLQGDLAAEKKMRQPLFLRLAQDLRVESATGVVLQEENKDLRADLRRAVVTIENIAQFFWEDPEIEKAYHQIAGELHQRWLAEAAREEDE